MSGKSVTAVVEAPAPTVQYGLDEIISIKIARFESDLLKSKKVLSDEHTKLNAQITTANKAIDASVTELARDHFKIDSQALVSILERHTDIKRKEAFGGKVVYVDGKITHVEICVAITANNFNRYDTHNINFTSKQPITSKISELISQRDELKAKLDAIVKKGNEVGTALYHISGYERQVRSKLATARLQGSAEGRDILDQLDKLTFDNLDANLLDPAKLLE